MSKVLIIGAGLFGSIAARLCREHGHEVTVIDSQEKMAASKCSACLFKPSWLESLDKEQVKIGWSVLEQYYNIQTVSFIAQAAMLKKRMDINWIDPAELLLAPDIVGEVTKIDANNIYANGEVFRQYRVLVAAGVWSANLVPTPPIKALVGANLRASGQLREAMLNIYAPYKQAVAFNISSKEIWIGDGGAILAKNWNEQERVQKLASRAADYFGIKQEVSYYVGARPYVEGHKHGYFAQVHPKVWVSTGGAKNGTLLAAYQAQRFLEAIR